MVLRQRVDGNVKPNTHALMVRKVLEYEDVLHEFRNLPALDESDLPDVSELKSLLGEKRSMVIPGEDAPGLKRGCTRSDVPAVAAETDIDQVIAISERLDDLAQKLGFGPEPDTDGVTADITKEHLEDAFYSGSVPDFPDDPDER
jgi:hypothetical protein